MEAVGNVVPMTLKSGAALLGQSAGAALSGTSSGEADARAQEALDQAQRAADAERRRGRAQVAQLEEAGQERLASEHVRAARSGVADSGSSLLSMAAKQAQAQDAVDAAENDSLLRQQDILAQGENRAQSIRLTGRSRSGGAGLGSLLTLAGRVLQQPKTKPPMPEQGEVVEPRTPAPRPPDVYTTFPEAGGGYDFSRFFIDSLDF